ncbi:protein stoned-B [Phlebotomus papatasi]|uniref:protein stoned-B n=1 Tax=Phlebotomus papatasi TaxID=29031 RepID=UPI002483F4DD|nr:protein stoned-B [Phlebotomus papatasi]
MANPFLMTDDDVVSPSSAAYSNPFLMTDGPEDDMDYAAENPFFGQVPVGATNPFAEFEEAAAQDQPLGTIPNNIDMYSAAQVGVVTTGMQLFMGADASASVTTTAANTFQPVPSGVNIFDEDPQKPMDLDIKPAALSNVFDDSGYAYSSEEELSKIKKKQPPGRPAVGPAKATQDLILSVADQLDMASSHLLGRIPATRTPSPVSMRDLHSPSPTPDAVGDLLDVSDGDLMAEPMNDNPFSEPQTISDQPPKTVDAIKSTPSRPPPPRPAVPPPKPAPPAIPQAPPSRPPAPVQPVPAQAEPDFMDIFGSDQPTAPKPAAPKTKEDILSLFSSPAPQTTNTQPDLLSGDIPELDSGIGLGMPVFGADLTSQAVPAATAIPAPIALKTEEAVIVHTPAMLTPPDEQVRFQEADLKIEDAKSDISSEHSGSNATITALPSSVTGSIGNIATPAELADPQEEVLPPPPQESEYPTSSSANPFASPTDEERANEPLYEVMETIVAPKFVPRPPPPRPAPPPIPPQPKVAPAPAAVPATAPAPIPTPAPAPIPASVPAPVIPPAPVAAPIVPVAVPVVPVSAPVVPVTAPLPPTEIFGIAENAPPPKIADEFDAFAAKFDSADAKTSNAFGDDPIKSVLNGFGPMTTNDDAWGGSTPAFGDDSAAADGFGAEEESFDWNPPAESRTYDRGDSHDSDDAQKDFSVVIKPREGDVTPSFMAAALAPPPKSSANSTYSGDSSPRVNPFDKGFEEPMTMDITPDTKPTFERTDSQESPPTPLFDEDVSQPLEDFPRIMVNGAKGWEMQLRQPNKKKITGQRFWKKIFLRLVFQGDNPVMQLFNSVTDKEPFQELPLQACYSVSEIGAQQYDQFGKIFTVKLQYIFYKERPGVRPGQVTKAERLTNKLSQFAAYAIQGDYQGVKEFGSDLKKLGLPVEHAPQVSQLFKIGSMSYEDMKQFSVVVEEALFKLHAHRDRALNYKSEEVQITAVDELYAEQDAEGHILKQIARVRLFFLGFLSGMPSIELGVNDLWRQGKEVVGRHDIIPVVTEEWIRLEGVEFHSCVQQDEYERTRTIKFQPPDACYIELMRFRVRPPRNRELPLQVKATWCVTGNRVELRVDVLVPGFASRKLGQIPCEDVAIRFPIPECWIYLFRVEKHFRYGSVKSAHRRTGKIKGIERILGTVDQLQESLIEVTSGQAKYEHHHRSIVWRCPRLPKEGQGAYTTHQMVCRMALTSYDQIPEQLAPYCYVEFTMPATQVSHTTVRSVSVQESDSDEPPEKYVRYLARHEYRVGIEHTQGENPNAYLAATAVSKPIKEEPPAPALSPMAPSDSDSDSN